MTTDYYDYKLAKTNEFADIPDDIFEINNIIPPEKTKELSDYLQSLTAPLLARDDVTVKKIRYLISADNRSNASIYPAYDIPVIVITLGMFEKIQNATRLQYVLFHEIAHKDLRNTTGINLFGRVDENGADAKAIEWMEEMGMDWQEAQRFYVEDNFQDPIIFRPEIVAQYILMPHSGDPERIKYMNMRMAERINNKKFAAPALGIIEPLPDWVKNVRNNLEYSHKSFFDIYKNKYDWENLTDEDRLKYIQEIAPEDALRNAKNFKDICSVLFFSAMSANILPNTWPLTDEKQKAYFESMGTWLDSFSEYLKTTHENLNDGSITESEWDIRRNRLLGIYSSASGHALDESCFEGNIIYNRGKPLNGLSLILPFGIYARTEEAINKFLVACTSEEALSAAKVLNEIVDKNFANLDWHPAIENFLMNFSNFKQNQKVQKKDNIYPWEKHVLWAVDDKTQAITNALWVLGVNCDKRLWNSLGADALEELSLKNFISVPFSVDEYKPAYNFHPYAIGISVNTNNAYDHSLENNRLNSLEIENSFSIICLKNHNLLESHIEKIRYNKNAKTITEMQPKEISENISDYAYQIVKKMDCIDFETEDSEEKTDKFKKIEKQIVNDLTELHRLNLLKDSTINELVNCEISDDNIDLYNFDDDDFCMGSFIQHVELYKKKYYNGSSRMDSPLVNFIIDDPLNIFSRRDKIYCLSNLDVDAFENNINIRQPMPKLDFWRKAIGYNPSIDELGSLGHDISFETDYIGFWTEEINALFGQHKFSAISKDISILIPGLMGVVYDQGDREERLAKNIKHVAEEYKKGDYKKCELPSTAHLIDMFHFYERIDAFLSNLDLREDLGEAILTSLKAEKSLQKQIGLCEKLVLPYKTNKGFNRKKSTNYYKLKSSAIEIWGNAIQDLMGIDDGSDAYLNKLKPKIEAICENSPPQTKYDMMLTLTDSVVSKKKLSEFCHSSMREGMDLENGLAQTHMEIAVGELFVRYFSSDDDRRKSFINFLLHPMDRAQAEVLANEMSVDGTDVLDKLSFKYSLIDNIITKEPETTVFLEDFHDFFWGQKLEVRAFMLDPLIISGQELKETMRQVCNSSDNKSLLQDFHTVRATEQALDHLFPQKENMSADDVADANFAKDFIRSYVKVSHQCEQSLILAAIMSSTMANANENGAMNVGDRLVLLAEMLGPAYRKVLQAGHGHPDVPKRIRDSLARTKTMSMHKPRWWLYKRFEETMPEELRQGVELGKIIGAASLFITADAVMPDGTTCVLSMLDDHAIEKARFGFEKLSDTAEHLAASHSDYKSTLQVFSYMLRQASDAMKIETDMKLGNLQNNIAMERYGDVEIVVSNETICLNPMPWLAYSDQARYMKKADGVNFFELPETTPHEKELKRRVAIAHLAVGFTHLLDGGRFDTDFHAGQSCIKRNEISRFDYGGITLDEPTKEEKMGLAESLKKIVQNGVENIQSSEILLNDIRLLQDKTGVRQDHLMNVQKSLLALNDFINYLNKESDLKKDINNILTSIIADGSVDKIYQEALLSDQKGIKSFMPSLLAKVSMFGNKEVRIKRIQGSYYAQAKYVPYSKGSNDNQKKTLDVPYLPSSKEGSLKVLTKAL